MKVKDDWGVCVGCGKVEGTNSSCPMCHWGFPERSMEFEEPVEP